MWSILFLAVVQGLTEFLPVSSSGHLALFQSLDAFHFDSPGIYLEVALHGGTLLSILVFYRSRITELLLGVLRGDAGSRDYAMSLLVATLPVAVGYLACRRMIESVFDKPVLVSALLSVTGLALLSLRLRRGRGTGADSVAVPPRSHPTWIKALWIGVAQAAAMLPGISRSGATIVTARHLGMPPKQAAEFSMLMAVPVLMAAIALTLPDVSAADMGAISRSALATGIAVSAVVGYIALRILVRVLSAERLWLFGVYCLAAAAAGMFLL